MTTIEDSRSCIVTEVMERCPATRTCPDVPEEVAVAATAASTNLHLHRVAPASTTDLHGPKIVSAKIRTNASGGSNPTRRPWRCR